MTLVFNFQGFGNLAMRSTEMQLQQQQQQMQQQPLHKCLYLSSTSPWDVFLFSLCYRFGLLLNRSSLLYFSHLAMALACGTSNLTASAGRAIASISDKGVRADFC